MTSTAPARSPARCSVWLYCSSRRGWPGSVASASQMPADGLPVASRPRQRRAQVGQGDRVARRDPHRLLQQADPPGDAPGPGCLHHQVLGRLRPSPRRLRHQRRNVHGPVAGRRDQALQQPQLRQEPRYRVSRPRKRYLDEAALALEAGDVPAVLVGRVVDDVGFRRRRETGCPLPNGLETQAVRGPAPFEAHDLRIDRVFAATGRPRSPRRPSRRSATRHRRPCWTHTRPRAGSAGPRPAPRPGPPGVRGAGTSRCRAG